VPIKPEFRKFYGLQWRTITRPRILARAGDKCEQCGKPNHAYIETRFAPRTSDGLMFWSKLTTRGENTNWYDKNGKPVTAPQFFESAAVIRVIICLAHLNHTPGDDGDENLKALCQWCHLRHDKTKHAAAAKVTRVTRKDAARPLLKELTT
jgi:hypothetical protein